MWETSMVYLQWRWNLMTLKSHLKWGITTNTLAFLRPSIEVCMKSCRKSSNRNNKEWVYRPRESILKQYWTPFPEKDKSNTNIKTPMIQAITREISLDLEQALTAKTYDQNSARNECVCERERKGSWGGEGSLLLSLHCLSSLFL